MFLFWILFYFFRIVFGLTRNTSSMTEPKQSPKFYTSCKTEPEDPKEERVSPKLIYSGLFGLCFLAPVEFRALFGLCFLARVFDFLDFEHQYNGGFLRHFEPFWRLFHDFFMTSSTSTTGDPHFFSASRFIYFLAKHPKTFSFM